MIANNTGSTMPVIIKMMLYPIVLRIIIQASLDLNKNSKFLKPTQGLFITLLIKPPEILNCLKAMIMPNMGK
ncbi:hypothetical protein D3C76_1801680 [compost metagenome]